MQSEDTPARLLPLQPPRAPSPLKRWSVIAGLIGALGLASSTVVQWVNWPWADKAALERVEADQIELRGVVIRLEEGQRRLEERMPAAVADELERRQHRRR